MARRDSPLYNFITDALMGNKYPFILYWVDAIEGIFCLKCICKSKKEWTPLHSKIFEDYHSLKPRKSNDKRQRFLVAMRACPFIEPLDDISTKEEKFYKFRAHGTLSSVGATDEIAALSASNEVDMQENPLPKTNAEKGFPVAENGPPPGDPSMEDNVGRHDLDNSWSPMLAGSNNPFLEVLNDPQICQLLRRVEVPDAAANVLESPGMGASPSLYEDPSEMMRSSPSCSQAPDSSDQSSLPAQELSGHFGMKESIPSDYDPAKAFLESMGNPKLAETSADCNLLGIMQTVPGSLEESAKCPSVKIVKLNDSDGIVKNLRGDNSKKNFFMMVLKTGK